MEIEIILSDEEDGEDEGGEEGEEWEEEEEEEIEEEEEEEWGEEIEEEEEVFVTPQSSIISKYISPMEKEMREICSELLNLKVAAVSQLSNSRACYQAFQRFSQDARRVNEIVVELKCNFSAYKSIVQDLPRDITSELNAWEKFDMKEIVDLDEIEKLLTLDSDNPQVILLQNLDMLIAEHKTEEALSMLLDSVEVIDNNSLEICKRKDMLIEQLVANTNQPCIKNSELKKSLEGLIKLGREALAQELLLKEFASRLQRKIDLFLPSCPVFPSTYTATLTHLVFATIFEATKEFSTLFGEIEDHTSLLVKWAEKEIENFVNIVKQKAPMLETTAALCSACICIQASLSYCAVLEGKGFKFSDLILFLLGDYIEEVIDKNFRRARRMVLDLSSQCGNLDQSWPIGLHFSADALTNIFLTNNIKKFMSILKGILDQLTPMAILHCGPIIMRKSYHLFDKYVEVMIKAIPTFSGHGTFYANEPTHFKAETDRQQLALLSSITAISDELLPMAISKMLASQGELTESEDGLAKLPSVSEEYRNWKRRIQHSLDKIRVHFCQEQVVRLIHLHKGKARLDAHAYLELEGDYPIGDVEPLPSLPFQALFGRLQKLTSIANEAFIGREKVQKSLLSGIIDAMLTWLSNAQDFWDLMDNTSLQFNQQGLQQFILDMRFIAGIATFGGYSSRKIHQLVSTIITRAIGAFAARGVDPQSVLHEDEWFSHAVKFAIKRLTVVVPASRESRRSYDDDVILHEKALDSVDMSSSSSDFESNSVNSFASLDGATTPGYFSSNEY